MKKHINVSISEEIWLKIWDRAAQIKATLQKRKYSTIDYVYDLILKDLKEGREEK